VVIRFVNIDRIVSHHCLKFTFISYGNTIHRMVSISI